MADFTNANITVLGQKLNVLVAAITDIKTVFDHPPVESDLATAILPAAAIGYDGLYAGDDDLYLKHRWSIVIFLTARKDAAAVTEMAIRTIGQSLLDGFENNKSLDGECVNVYPIDAQTDVLESKRARKIVNTVLMMTVITDVVRR